MRVLVIGASGGTGQQLVERLIERGHRTTAFLRDPARLQIRDERVEIAVGDVRDKFSVEKAIAGHDAVLCALGHKRWFYPNRILSAGTQNIVDAMKKEGVKRLVCETSLGVGDSFGRLGVYYTLFVVPFILPFYYWDKYCQEQVVRRSGLDWIIVRPATLTNGPRRGKYRHGPHVGNWFLTLRVSRADVADFMIQQLTEDTYLHATPAMAY